MSLLTFRSSANFINTYIYPFNSANCLQGDLLKGKWALVTGSSRGIGRAVAEAMAAEGASLIITSEPNEQKNLDMVASLCCDGALNVSSHCRPCHVQLGYWSRHLCEV